MKAVSVPQPQAKLAGLGVCTVLTFSWSTDHRGPLALHVPRRGLPAGALFPRGLNQGEAWSDPIGDWRALWEKRVLRGRTLMERYSLVQRGERERHSLPIAAVVATCTLVDVVPTADVRWDDHEREPFVAEEEVTRLRRLHLSESQRPYGDFGPGRYVWVLEDVVEVLPPLKQRGRPRLWDFDGARLTEDRA